MEVLNQLGRILENLPKVVLENGGIEVEMKELKNENDASFGNPLDQFTRDPDKADPNTLFGDDRLQRGQDNRAFDLVKNLLL